MTLGITTIRQKGTHVPLSISGAAKARTRESRRETLDASGMQTEITWEPLELLLRGARWGWDSIQELSRDGRREARRL